MKGTLSEMELSTLRQPLLEALRLKASCGELFLGVALGYVKVRRDLQRSECRNSKVEHLPPVLIAIS